MGVIQTSCTKGAGQLQNDEREFTEKIRYFDQNRKLHERKTSQR